MKFENIVTSIAIATLPNIETEAQDNNQHVFENSIVQVEKDTSKLNTALIKPDSLGESFTVFDYDKKYSLPHGMYKPKNEKMIHLTGNVDPQDTVSAEKVKIEMQQIKAFFVEFTKMIFSNKYKIPWEISTNYVEYDGKIQMPDSTTAHLEITASNAKSIAITGSVDGTKRLITVGTEYLEAFQCILTYKIKGKEMGDLEERQDMIFFDGDTFTVVTGFSPEEYLDILNINFNKL